MPCDGYAFGWNICDFEGHRLYIHGGGYTGARTMMAFAPELGVGIGVFSNSDNMTGWLTSRTVVQFLQYLVEHPDAEKWAELRQKAYPERVHRFLDARHKQSTDARNAEAWKGWTWKPGVAALDSYVGRYRGERLPVDVEVSLLEQALLMRAGAMQRRLEPATPDLFGATWLRFDTAEPLRFLRGGDGVVIGFEYEGERYLRVSAP